MNIIRGLRFSNISDGKNNNKEKKNIEVEKAGRTEVREDTTIRSNDISQRLLRVEHLDGKRRGGTILPFPFPSCMRSYFLIKTID